jgi:hypothetical protein
MASSIPDLRHLSRVCRRLHLFARKHFVRYQYTSGLVNLPNEIILEVVELLDTRKDCSQFARTSQRFYPIIMEFIVRHNFRYEGSSLLLYASRENRIDFAKKILHLGGDVEATEEPYPRETPLALAASSGHGDLVRLFLKCGAKQIFEETWYSLGCALHKGHEDIAIILSQDLEADTALGEERGSLLAGACEAKFPRLVRILLERDLSVLDEQHVRVRSEALHALLYESAHRGQTRRTELLENDYQIVMVLLQHGADPELGIKRPHSMFPRFNTICKLAVKHPDPRVRDLFWRGTAASHTKQRKPNRNVKRPLLHPQEASGYQ